MGGDEVVGEGVMHGQVGRGEFQALGSVVGGAVMLPQPSEDLSEEVSAYCKEGGCFKREPLGLTLLAVDALRQRSYGLAEDKFCSSKIFLPQAGHPFH